MFIDDSFNLLSSVSIQAHTSTIYRIKQSPFNNGYVATCSRDYSVKIWDPNTNWTLVKIYMAHNNVVYSLEWIDEDTIASSSIFSIRIWSVSTGITKRIIQICLSCNWGVHSLKLLSNGFYLAAGLNINAGSGISIYNINTGGLISTLQGQKGTIFELILIGDELLASSSEDKTICIWDLKSNTLKLILYGHTSQVYGLKLVSSGILASGSSDKTVRLWSTTTGQLIRTLSNYTNSIWWSVDLLYFDKQTLVSGSLDKTIKLWDWNTGQCLKTINSGIEITSSATIKSKSRFILLKKHNDCVLKI